MCVCMCVRALACVRVCLSIVSWALIISAFERVWWRERNMYNCLLAKRWVCFNWHSLGLQETRNNPHLPAESLLSSPPPLLSSLLQACNLLNTRLVSIPGQRIISLKVTSTFTWITHFHTIIRCAIHYMHMVAFFRGACAKVVRVCKL